MTAGSILPLQLFPGFSATGLISPQIVAAATVFNAEGLDALSGIPEAGIAWADVGTRVTPGSKFVTKVPIRLTSMLGFTPFNGTREYHEVNVSAVTINSNAMSLNLDWPIQIDESGLATLEDIYGLSGIAGDVVAHARAAKADAVASLIQAGQTNAVLGMTATALTLPQPGYPNGLPLFSDGTTSGASQHFSNPLVPTSAKFPNLFLGAGKITDTDVFGTVLTNMNKVPHPTKANMTMGLSVTDIIGPTSMLIPFYKLAIQQLSLQTTTSPANLAAATTNIYNPNLVASMSPASLIGVSGLTPWRFLISPQLDSHAHVVANPTKQMWLAVSRTKASGAWCEMTAPTKEFTPRITMLGDGTEEARKTRRIKLLADLDVGVAAGLPHFCALYTETTPT